jgi:hypothetical protein
VCCEGPVHVLSAYAAPPGCSCCCLQVLRAHGVRVLTVREILAFGVEERMGARVELEDLAAGTLTYRLADGEWGGGGVCMVAFWAVMSQ